MHVGMDRRGRGGGTKVSYTSPTFAIAAVLLVVEWQGGGGGAPGSLLLSKLINSSSCSTLVHQSITPNALTRRSAMHTMALAFATASLASYLPPYHETRAMF